jgi:hypothetical protein
VMLDVYPQLQLDDELALIHLDSRRVRWRGNIAITL